GQIFDQNPLRTGFEGGASEGEYENSLNLQWAHGKAGEDKVYIVLSGNHLYKAIDKELEGLHWNYEPKISINGNSNIGLECNKEDWEISFNNEISKDNGDVRGNKEQNLCNYRKSSLGVEPEYVPLVNFAGRGENGGATTFVLASERRQSTRKS
ncbi:hypothetical protein Godav_006411, partial [Gossypium davidsonii]|nr:hypothetical protein [Gossypium davidsonii]